MPNTSVRATAEGMPALNRRTALAMTSAGIVSAITVLSSSVKASPVAPSLQDALSACQSAVNTYSACTAKEAAIADGLGDKLFPKWTPPGGLASIWSHRPRPFRASLELEIEIARKSEQVEASFAGGLMTRAAYDRWTHDLATQGREGLTSLREQEAGIEAAGYHEAYRLSDEAFRDARAAFYAVLRHPCQTIEDVRAKAACLLRAHERLGIEIAGEEFVACLSSLCEEV